MRILYVVLSLLLVFISCATVFYLYLMSEDVDFLAASLVFDFCNSANVEKINEFQSLYTVLDDTGKQRFKQHIEKKESQRCVILQVLYVASLAIDQETFENVKIEEIISDSTFPILLLYNSIDMIQQNNGFVFNELSKDEFIKRVQECWNNENHKEMILHKRDVVFDSPPQKREILKFTNAEKLFLKTKIVEKPPELVINAIQNSQRKKIFMTNVNITFSESFVRIHIKISQELDRDIKDAEILRKRIIYQKVHAVSDKSDHSEEQVTNWSHVVLVKDKLLEDVQSLTIDSAFVSEEAKTLLQTETNVFKYQLNNIKQKMKLQGSVMFVGEGFAKLLENKNNNDEFKKVTGASQVQVKKSNQHVIEFMQEQIGKCFRSDNYATFFTDQEFKNLQNFPDRADLFKNLAGVGKSLINIDGLEIQSNDSSFDPGMLCVEKTSLVAFENNKKLTLDLRCLELLDNYQNIQNYFFKNFARLSQNLNATDVGKLEILNDLLKEKNAFSDLKNVRFIHLNGTFLENVSQKSIKNVFFGTKSFFEKLKEDSIENLSTEIIQIMNRSSNLWNFFLNNIKIKKDVYKIQENLEKMSYYRRRNFFNKLLEIGFSAIDEDGIRVTSFDSDEKYTFVKTQILEGFKNLNIKSMNLQYKELEHMRNFKFLRLFMINNLLTINQSVFKFDSNVDFFSNDEISLILKRFSDFGILHENGTVVKTMEKPTNQYKLVKTKLLNAFFQNQLLYELNIEQKKMLNQHKSLRKYYYCFFADLRKIHSDAVQLLVDFQELEIFQQIAQKYSHSLVFCGGKYAVQEYLTPQSKICAYPTDFLNFPIDQRPLIENEYKEDNEFVCSFFLGLSVNLAYYSNVNEDIIRLVNDNKAASVCFFQMLKEKNSLIISETQVLYSGIQIEGPVVCISEENYKKIESDSLDFSLYSNFRSDVIVSHFCSKSRKNLICN